MAAVEHEGVGTGTAEERVMAGTAVDPVIVIPGMDRVIARAGKDRVIVDAGRDRIVALPGPDQVIATAGRDGVVARAAVDPVRSLASVETVIARAADQQRVTGVQFGKNIHPRRAQGRVAKDELLDIGERIDALRRNNGIDSAVPGHSLADGEVAPDRQPDGSP